jgi:CDP-glycerol glycerophosphotransferase (TagB/SpsB family)
MPISQCIAQLSQRQISLILIILKPFEYLAAFLDFLYPKDNKTIVFGSETGEFVSGSPKALFAHIKENHPEYKVYFYTPFKKSLETYAKIKYILKFAHIFFKAKFLVSSHPPSDFYPFAWSNRKVLINTWHGTPLKAMFFADSGDTKSNLKRILWLNKKISAFIVSSKLEAATLAECFLINPRKFYYLGQPRNDILLKNPADKTLPNIIGTIPEYKKVILYCPTYRRDAPTEFFPFDDFDLQHLNNFLEENKIIILLRGHVYNKKSEKENFSERVIDFGFEICNDVNLILPEVDIMVTDYSSIYIDYLLLDRPCIFVPYDLEEYKRKRGLLYDDYDFWAPGHKVLTYKEFIAAIGEIVSGRDVYKNRREEINRQFNYYQTENSCEKVFKLIENWKKEEYL